MSDEPEYEVDKVVSIDLGGITLESGLKVRIVGPIVPGVDPDLDEQWEHLKKTGIGPGHPDF